MLIYSIWVSVLSYANRAVIEVFLGRLRVSYSYEGMRFPSVPN